MKTSALIASAVALALGSSAAFAGTADDTFTVNATVVASCSVVANDLAFGDVDPFLGKTGSATMAVTCSSGAAYDVGLSAGTTAGATVANRLLAGTGFDLPYNLYSDSGHSVVWGNTVDTDTVAGTGNGDAQSLTVYGSIPAEATAPIGAYSDSITVTVTF